MLFNVCYLISQFIVQIGGWDDPATNEHFALLRYIGLIFGSGKPSLGARNMSIVYQLLVAFVGLINLRDFDRRIPSPRFEAYLPIRIYNAICALLHHCMPLLIQISLCTSTLFNPSIFGWFSYVIMIIVNYVPSVLDNWANLITSLFNICFMIQYLLFLGWPPHIFGSGFDIMDKLPDSYSPDQRQFVLDWLKWAGIYDVTTTALVSNCISAMIFTFYLDWHNAFVDYDMRFNVLPIPMKALIRLFMTYSFEILTPLNLIVNYIIDTIDTVLFFILMAAFMIVSLFHRYPKIKTLQIMSIVTFTVIALHLMSRIPVSTDNNIGKWVQE
jgi:hypothetical protein